MVVLEESAQPNGHLRAKASHRLPILSLVDREYLHSTASLPRMAWEPLSYLYSEADSQVAMLEEMDLDADANDLLVEMVVNGYTQEDANVFIAASLIAWRDAKERALLDFNKMHRWLDQLLLDSQSVDALRSWQMVGGLQAVNGDTRRPSATVMPDFPQPHHPGNAPAKRGLRLRGDRNGGT